jgi:hypothetical protein
MALVRSSFDASDPFYCGRVRHCHRNCNVNLAIGLVVIPELDSDGRVKDCGCIFAVQSRLQLPKTSKRFLSMKEEIFDKEVKKFLRTRN